MSGLGAAQAAKEKGNAAFKAGDYVGAIGHYTDAALADRLEPTYPLNRAAYLKLGKHADAERDCSTSLALSPGNVKALFRRAQARSSLRKLDEAEKDLNDALKREPANDAVKQELSKLREIRAQARALKKAPVSVATPLPGSSTPASTSTPARRRIPIAIDRDYDINEEPPVRATGRAVGACGRPSWRAQGAAVGRLRLGHARRRPQRRCEGTNSPYIGTGCFARRIRVWTPELEGSGRRGWPVAAHALAANPSTGVQARQARTLVRRLAAPYGRAGARARGPSAPMPSGVYASSGVTCAVPLQSVISH